MNKALANVTNVILKTLLIISTLILCYWIHNIQLTFSFVFLNHTIPSPLLPSINTTTAFLYPRVLHPSNIPEKSKHKQGIKQQL